MGTIEQLKIALVAEGVEDFLGLWEFLWEARETLGVTESPRDREVALDLVRDLLEEGLIQPGAPIDQGPGFDPWELSPSEALKRIEAEWDLLDDDPFTGDIVWFVTTPKGENWLRTKQGPAA